jgi:AcrR family transcriptional regulator
MSEQPKRTGSETKAEAQRIALSLFISKGYEATSLREIAEQLGISKASLYYHFASKEDIVKSGLAARGAEAAELLAWVQTQQPGPELLERTVLRWVETTSVDKLRGIRFVNANPVVLRNISANAGSGIRDGLEAVVDLVAGADASPTRLLLVRMAFLSINSAVSAANGTASTDEEIVAAAKEMALAILGRLRDQS